VFYVPANTVGYRLYGRRFLQVKRPNQQHQRVYGRFPDSYFPRMGRFAEKLLVNGNV